MKKPLRIAINAQIPDGSGAGGIETVLRVLTAINQFGGDEEYVFIGHWRDSDWLETLLSERQTLVRAPRPAVRKQSGFKRLTKPLHPILRGVTNLFAPPKNQIIVPVSDGFYESLNCDVIHFPYQDYVYCQVPTVYNPHDLQHLHFPEFFTPAEIERREIVYPAACRAAETIVVASEFVKQDVIKRYGIAAEKIRVIYWSPPEIEIRQTTENEVSSLLEQYACPPRPFVLYPAMTWEHKNHLRLLEAVYLLRERDGLIVNVVCTGHRNSFFAQIEKRLHELNLENQIRFTGIVEYRELSAFYKAAQFVIVPTLFEAMSAPLFEAWQHETPVACSSVTSLPEQAAGATLLFDPYSVEEIAGALKTLATDEILRSALRAKGTKRLRDFSLERTMKSYRAVYRKAAGAELGDEDRAFLESNY